MASQATCAMAYYPQISTSVTQPFMTTSYAQGLQFPVNRFEHFLLKTSQALEFLSNRITSLEQSLSFSMHSVNETKERTIALADQMKIQESLSDKHFEALSQRLECMEKKSDLEALSQRFECMEKTLLQKVQKVDLIEALIKPRKISSVIAPANTKHYAATGTAHTVRVWLAGFRSRGRTEKEIFETLAETLQTPLLNAQRGGHGWLLFDAPREEFQRLRSLKIGEEHDFPSGLKLEMARECKGKTETKSTRFSNPEIRKHQQKRTPNSLQQMTVLQTKSYSTTRSGGNLASVPPTSNLFEPLSVPDQPRKQTGSASESSRPDSPANLDTSLSDRDSPPAGSRSRRSHRSSAEEHIINSPEPAIVAQPMRNSRKAGALKATAPHDESRSSVIIPSREVIEAEYDLDTDGHWTFRTKKWCQSPSSEGLQAIEVDGCGNCFWECLTKAQVSIPQLVTRSGAQTYSSPPEHYTEYKRQTFEYFRSSEFEAFRQDQNFANEFPVYADLSQPGRLAELEHALTTDGAFSNEHVLQTAALALRINIHVESLETPGVVLESYSGRRGDSDARRQVRLLYRCDAQHPIFTTNFEPLRNRQGKLELSEGHFWLISKVNESPLPQVRSNRRVTNVGAPGNA